MRYSELRRFRNQLIMFDPDVAAIPFPSKKLWSPSQTLFPQLALLPQLSWLSPLQNWDKNRSRERCKGLARWFATLLVSRGHVEIVQRMLMHFLRTGMNAGGAWAKPCTVVSSNASGNKNSSDSQQLHCTSTPQCCSRTRSRILTQRQQQRQKQPVLMQKDSFSSDKNRAVCIKG